MAVTWARSSNGPSALAPQTVLVKARTSSGEFLFEGSIGAAGESTVADLARFSVPPGRVELDLAVIGLNGQVLDTDIRNIEVPDFPSGRPGPVVLPPEIVVARTARDHQSALANPLSTPSPVRVFARGDRLVIRVPAFDPSGEGVDVGLKVLNRRMQPMRTILPFTAVAPPVGTLTGSESTPAVQGSHPAPPERGVTMFSLPLSWLPPGEYELEVTAANSRGSARERIGFRVR